MVYKNKQKNRFALIVLAAVLLFSTINVFNTIHVTQAAAPVTGNEGKTYTLLEPLPCLGGPGCAVGQPMTQINLGDFFQYAFNLLIALSAVAAVFMMVYGGFLYMTSDAWSKKSEGLEKFKNAIYGLLMVLGAYLILRTVNPKLVAIPASIPKIEVPNSMTQSPLAAFNELNALATDVPEARDILSQAQADMTALQTKRADLELKRQALLDLGLNENDPDVTDLDVEIAKIYDNEINTRTNILVAQEAVVVKKYLNSSDCNSPGNLQRCIDSIDSTYRNYSQTQYAVDNPEALNKLKEQRDWAEAMLKINAEVSKTSGIVKSQETASTIVQATSAVASWLPTGFIFRYAADKLTPSVGISGASAQQSIANIQQIQNEYNVRLVNNPDLRNQLQTTAQSATQAINSLKK